MSEAPSPLSAEQTLVEAARQMVAALSDAKTTPKRRAKLRKIAESATLLRRLNGTDRANIVPIRGHRDLVADSSRARAAVAALILQAVEAERATLGSLPRA